MIDKFIINGYFNHLINRIDLKPMEYLDRTIFGYLVIGVFEKELYMNNEIFEYLEIWPI